MFFRDYIVIFVKNSRIVCGDIYMLTKMETLTDVYIEHDCEKSLHVGFIADISSEIQRLKINNSFTDGVSNFVCHDYYRWFVLLK